MELKKDFISRINENFARMSKGQKAIASYIYDNFEQAAFMTAAKIGAEVGVSESTVVRFASFIGYNGFPEFQRDLESFIQDKLSSVSQIDFRYGKSSQSDILNSVLGSDIEKIQHTIENLDPNAFETAVDFMLGAKHVYIMGLRSCEPLARFLHFYLSMVRPDVILISTTSVTETFEQMIRVNEEDCVVGISFPRYSMRTLKALEFAKDRSAKVVSITDSVYSPLNLYSSCNLLARSDMVSIVDSLVAPLSVINALVVAFVLKSPDSTRENLKQLEFAWNNYQVYLNDEINFIGDEPMLNVPLWKNNSDNKEDEQ